MREKLFLLIVIASINLFSVNCAVENNVINCNYTTLRDNYACVTDVVRITDLNNVRITGNHESGLSDNDVVTVQFNTSSEMLDIPQVVFTKFPNLVNLHVDHIGIEKISKIVKCENLQTVSFGLTQVVELDDNVFSNCKKLEVVIAVYTNLTTINPLAFQGTSLKELILTFSKISIITKENLAGLESLEEIELSGNKIRRIEEGAFEQLPKLQKLSLDLNSCISKSFQRSNWREAYVEAAEMCFLGFRSDKMACKYKLFLGSYTCLIEDSNIVDIWPIEISGTHLGNKTDKDVETVYMTNSNLTGGIPVKLFEKFPNIKMFMSIIGIQLTSKNIQPLQICENLDSFTLTFYSNSIVTLSTDLFRNCKNLRTISLRSQSIDEIGNRVFDGLESLVDLQLTSEIKRIDFIRPGTFSSLRSLKSLRLFQNGLRRIENHYFSGLSQLELLDLSRNFIREIDNNALQELKSLQNLNLENNYVETITKGQFRKLKIKYINLKLNRISRIQPNAFEQLPLVELNLLYNTEVNYNFNPFDSKLYTNAIQKNFDNFRRDVIVCEYVILNGLYTCIVLDFKLTERRVLKVTGHHLEAYNDNDVRSVVFSGIRRLSVLPKSIFSYFRNLQNLTMDFAGLGELDPIPCNSLKFFSAKFNNLTNITRNTFNGCTQLKEIDLSYNNIETIEEGAFDSLVDVKTINLKKNICTDVNILFSLNLAQKELQPCYDNAKCGSGQLVNSFLLLLVMTFGSIVKKYY